MPKAVIFDVDGTLGASVALLARFGPNTFGEYGCHILFG